MDWKFINFDNIEGETPLMDDFNAINKYDFKNITVINDTSFTIYGNNVSEKIAVSSSAQGEAIAFVSTDNGNSFTKYNFGLGELTEAFPINNSIYFSNNTSKGIKKSSTLIKVTDYTNPEIQKFVFETEKINDIRFYNEKIGIANFFSITNDDEHHFINKYTLDGGETWSTIKNNDELSSTIFASENEILYLKKDKLIKYNFVKNTKEVVEEKIALNDNYSEGFLERDPLNNELYTFIDTDDGVAIYYLNSKELIELPETDSYINTYGNFYHTLSKDGPYYNYVWSDNKGKTWHTEKLTDFFIIPTPVTLHHQKVYSLVTLFKGSQKERGGRFAIGKLLNPSNN